MLGVGTQHIFARNRLQNNITTAQFRGGYEMQGENDDTNHFLQWGLKYQTENIDDRLNEWERIDSAGYSLPFDESQVLLNEVIRSDNEISSYRLQGFLQNGFSLTKPNRYELKLTGGVRAHYWSYSRETNISPRFQIFYKPLGGEKDITFKLSGGVYYQPPFYRELRRPSGEVNPQIMAQKSTHLVAGLSYDFFLEEHQY